MICAHDGKHEDAAIELRPDYAEAVNNRSGAREQLRLFGDALAAPLTRASEPHKSIYVINLGRTPGRFADFAQQNAHIHASRFSAVDGRSISRQDLIYRSVLASDFTYTDGALGNALSHLALWDMSIETNVALTICEDDAIVNRHFVDDAEAIVNSLPEDWHFILWGWNFDSYVTFDMITDVSPAVVQFDQSKMRMGAATFQSTRIKSRAFRLHRAFGLCCYSISPSGARALKDLCLPLRNMNVFFPGLNCFLVNSSFDVMTSEMYPKINAFLSFPPLVINMNDHAVSTVQRQELAAIPA